MGSGSTYIPSKMGGIGGRPLQAGQLLETGKEMTALSRSIESSLHMQQNQVSFAPWGIEQDADMTDPVTIRATEGHEQAWFGTAGMHAFWQQVFSVSHRSNRMGTRLAGSSIPVEAKGELLSTAVTRGTVQVTHDGTPMILMADAQTTGGYPRIAQVAAADLSICAQLRPGEHIRFRQISAEEAEELYLAQERTLRQLQRSIDLRYGI
jgi:antagonist of KipI